MKIISSVAKDISFNYSNSKTQFAIPPEKFTDLNREYNFVIDGESLNSYGTCNIFSTQNKPCIKSSNFPNLLVLSLCFPNNYGHCLQDVLPTIIYHDLHSSADHIFCPKSEILDSLIQLFDIKFSKTTFINPSQTISVNTSRICIYRLKHPIDHRYKSKILSFKNLINKKFKTDNHPEEFTRLIYCTRNTSTDVKHMRFMNDQNEKDIVHHLEDFAKTHNLVFTIFNGQENGRTMSHKNQAKLFREASVVVGPHGSAMSNVLYLDEYKKPIVCEFCSGTEVQIHGGVFDKHYNALYAYSFDDSYDYYLIPFEKQSTKFYSSIDIKNLKRFTEIITQNNKLT